MMNDSISHKKNHFNIYKHDMSSIISHESAELLAVHGDCDIIESYSASMVKKMKEKYGSGYDMAHRMRTSALVDIFAEEFDKGVIDQDVVTEVYKYNRRNFQNKFKTIEDFLHTNEFTNMARNVQTMYSLWGFTVIYFIKKNEYKCTSETQEAETKRYWLLYFNVFEMKDFTPLGGFKDGKQYPNRKCLEKFNAKSSLVRYTASHLFDLVYDLVNNTTFSILEGTNETFSNASTFEVLIDAVYSFYEILQQNTPDQVGMVAATDKGDAPLTDKELEELAQLLLDGILKYSDLTMKDGKNRILRDFLKVKRNETELRRQATEKIYKRFNIAFDFRNDQEFLSQIDPGGVAVLKKWDKSETGIPTIEEIINLT